MSEPFEGAVVAALRSRDEGVIDVEALRTGAVRRARTRRRRRVALVSAGLVLALAASTQLLLSYAGQARLQIGGPPVQPSGLLDLPAAAAPSIMDDPTVLGTDPATLHFGLDAAALDASRIGWNTWDNLEEAEVWNRTVDHFNVWYYLSRDKQVAVEAASITQMPGDPEQPITVLGRPGTVQRFPNAFGEDVWMLTWQPVDGVWSVILATGGVDAVINAAQALQLDRAQRCVVPFAFTQRPAGWTWTGCGIMVSLDKPWELGDISLRDDRGVDVRAFIGNTAVDSFTPDRTVNGRPAQWSVDPTHGTRTLAIPIRDWVNLGLVQIRHKTDPPAELQPEEAVRLAELIDVGNDFTDPSGWPERAVP